MIIWFDQRESGEWMYEDLIVGRIDNVTVFRPGTFSWDGRPKGLPLIVQKGWRRLQFLCTPAQGVTPDIVAGRAKNVKRNRMIAKLDVSYHVEPDGSPRTFVTFSGTQTSVCINEFESRFWKPADTQDAVYALMQLPRVVLPAFAVPPMPAYMKPIFGYAKVVASLICRDLKQ
jgi:hypothetical protein